MDQGNDFSQLIKVQYDPVGDILTFSFTPKPVPALAEEAADEIWVRYEPDTNRVITLDVLNFSTRVEAAFGPQLTYTERTEPERLEAIEPLKALASGQV